MRGDTDQSTLLGARLIARTVRGPALVRSLAAVIGTTYLTAVLGGRWLGGTVLWLASGIVFIALGTAWYRGGRPRNAGIAASLGLPLHLLLLATGGLTSPLAPALALWLLLLSSFWSFRRIAGFGLVMLAWTSAIEVLWGILEWRSILEGALIVTCGILPALLLERARPGVRPGAGVRGRAPGSARLAQSGEDRGTADRRVEELTAALDRIRESLGGARAVLWEVDTEADEARPQLVSGEGWPPAAPLTGDPLRLALDEGIILRIETPPRWAIDSARSAILPIERPGEYTALLTVEYPDEALFPPIMLFEEAAARLRAFLDMQREAELASLTRERFTRITALLRQLPIQFEVSEFAAQLAEAAREFTGMSGAAVARWEGDAGQIIAIAGEDGGVVLGTEFGPDESELALVAARAATSIRQRQRNERGALPILARGERWFAEPRSILLLPLENPASGVAGVLALWSAEPAPIDPEQVEILQVVTPYAAMQLHQLYLYRPLQDFAERDPLTGLYNRRVFDERIEAEDARFQRYGRSTALLVLDIDHFKRINDTYGHEAGDAALRALAGVIRSAIRGTDLAARLGGEEFVVFLPETTLAGALEIAERLRRRVEEMVVEWQGDPIEVRASIGVAACPECAQGPAQLLATADAALYTSKRTGRNRVTAAPYGVSSGSNG